MILRMRLSPQEITEVRRIIEENTGYIFKSRIILNQVFRRSSLASETGQQSNELFEFIGDHILNYYVVKIIANKLGGWSLTGDFIFKIRDTNIPQIKIFLIISKVCVDLLTNIVNIYRHRDVFIERVLRFEFVLTRSQYLHSKPFCSTSLK